MLQVLTRFFLRVIILSIILALAHWALVEYTALSLPRESLFGMHIFIVVLTLASFAGVVLIRKASYDLVAFGFLGLSLFKMMASLIYLWPVISSENPDMESRVMHFFAIYFIYLFIEALEVMKLLKDKPSEEYSEKE